MAGPRAWTVGDLEELVAVRAETRRLRWEMRRLRHEHRLMLERAHLMNARAHELHAVVTATRFGLGAVFELGDADELEEVRPALELVPDD
jgi:hypothetical protein